MTVDYDTYYMLFVKKNYNLHGKSSIPVCCLIMCMGWTFCAECSFVYCIHIRLTKNSVYQGTIYSIVTVTRAVVTENTMHDSAFSRPVRKVTEQISMCFL